jgi:hypothetical protein
MPLSHDLIHARLTCAALLVAGCTAFLPGSASDNPGSSEPPRFSIELAGEARAPLPQPGTTWIIFSRDLPVGFEHPRETGADGQSVMLAPRAAAPGYPTAEDPHAVVGRLIYEYSSGRVGLAREYAGRLLEFAAGHGANAVYQAEDWSYWALYVSEATPDHPSADSVLANLVPKRGTVLAKRSFDLGDQHPGSFEATVKRGKCYYMALALSAQARRNRTLGWGAAWSSMTPDRNGTFRPTTATIGLFNQSFDGIADRGVVVRVTCPLVGGKTTFELEASRYAHTAAGSGEVVVALVETPLNRRDLIQASCDRCDVRHFACGNMTRASCAPAVKCLAEQQVRPGMCR